MIIKKVANPRFDPTATMKGIESRPGGGTAVKIHLPLPAGDGAKPDGARRKNTTND